MISVVIPHLNQHEALRKCLQSLNDQENFAGEVEVIVVDNGSASLPAAICEEAGNVTLLSEPEAGPGPARNLGIAAAKGGICAFIDADCRAHPDWLAAISTAFEDPDVHVIGGDVQVPYTDPENPTALEAYERIFAYRNKQYVASGYSGTGNLAMRRPVADAVGPFAGIDVAEDRDWGLRARAKGFVTQYVAEMIVYHPARETISEMHRKWDRHIAHDFTNVNGVKDKLRWVVKAGALAVSPVLELPLVLRSDRVSGPRERLLAFACLTRIRLYRSARMASVLLTGDGAALSGAWNRE